MQCDTVFKMERPTFILPKKLRPIVKKKNLDNSYQYKIFKYIMKFKKNHQRIVSFLRRVNPNYNDVNDKGQCFMSMLIEKKIIFEALTKLAISRDLELMRPMRYGSLKPIAVGIIENGGEKSMRVVLQQLLIEERNELTDKGDTFPHFLIRRGFTEAFRITLDFVNDVNIRNIATTTLLHHAVHESNLEIVKYLLDKGADVNAIDFNQDTPLHIAANLDTNNKTAIIELLLQFTADKNAPNFQRLRPFEILVASSRIEASAILSFFSACNTSNELNSHIRILTSCYYANPSMSQFNDKALAMVLLQLMLKSSDGRSATHIKYDKFANHRPPFQHAVLARQFNNIIQTIKEISLADTCITLWDIAISPVEQIANFFINKEVREAAQSCEIENCSVLEYLIKTKIHQACKRRNFSLRCVPYMRKVLNLHLATPSLEILAQHLEAYTLHNILGKYKQITGFDITTSAFFDSSISIKNQPTDFKVFEEAPDFMPQVRIIRHPASETKYIQNLPFKVELKM